MEQKEIIAKVVKNLQKNGFPTATVSFPSSQMAGFAHKHDMSLGSLLSLLEQHHIHHEFKDDRVYFTSPPMPMDMNDMQESIDAIMGAMGMNMEELKGLPPEESRSRLMGRLSSLSPTQMIQLQKAVMNMPAEQRKQLMDVASIFGVKERIPL